MRGIRGVWHRFGHILLSGLQKVSQDIYGKHVDIWLRVSERFHERCKLGRLVDCG